MRSHAVAAIVLLSATLGSTQIDPESVPIALRENWCTSQKEQCPLICTQVQDGSASTIENDCFEDTLTFTCICANNIAPNASQYTQTIPYFICTEANTQCVADCGQNSECARVCREERPCAAQDPPKGTATLTTTRATATATRSSDSDEPESTDGSEFEGLGGDPQPTDSSDKDPNAGGKDNAAQVAVNLGRSYGLAVVFTGLFAGFALLL